MSTTSSPCAACKFLRRKCTQECVFAPYFPPDQPNKFASVHRVYGASNVAKLLHDLSPALREDAVNSLAYEAEARLSDPVHGCITYINLLQIRVRQVQADLAAARQELSSFIGPAAYAPFLPQLHAAAAATSGAFPQPHQFLASHRPPAAASPFAVPNMGMGIAIPGGGDAAALQQAQILHIQEQQMRMAEAQQMAAAVEVARDQEMMTANFHPAYHDEQAAYSGQVGAAVGQMQGGGDGSGVGPTIAIASKPPSGLALVQNPDEYETAFLVQPQPQMQAQQPSQNYHQEQQLLPHEFLIPPPPPQQQQRAQSDDGRSGIGPFT